MKIIKKVKLDLKNIDSIVIPVFKGEDIKRIFVEYPESKYFVRKFKFKGKVGDSIIFNSSKKKKLFLIIGAGDSNNKIDTRKCSKNIISKLKECKVKNCIIQFIQEARLKRAFFINFIDYLFINNYKFRKYLRDKSDEVKKINIVLNFKNKLTQSLIKEREKINESIELVRDCINEIPSEVNPDYMVDLSKKLAIKNRLEIVVLREKELKKQNMTGILSVGRASQFEPALIKLSYIPEKYSKTITVVGKGITFDSGGLNIKVGNYMKDMKCDMSGSAAALGIIKAASDLKLPIKIHSISAVAENMPGQMAYKPGDIITYRNKKTVEVVNTDAEGRLVLADALILAAEDKPDYIVEFSTLTGAIIIALGDLFAGLMGNNKRLISMLIRSGENTGELLWEMPMFVEYKESIKSKIANLKNANYNGASSIKAGLFLEEFIGKIPFVHIDIAGTAFISKPNSFFLQDGATGFGVRLIHDFLSHISL